MKRVRLDANFLLRFLRMQKFEIKEACEILDKYITMRCQHPSWFQNLDSRVSQSYENMASLPAALIYEIFVIERLCCYSKTKHYIIDIHYYNILYILYY